MRIQHNIMAMNAYRNYTNNVSAMKGNLEKLSSGYKINRAGDDAAGLAISEKMRAQITGLKQAQNNAKSGINLVQTAEGALQEVQDMLNRMVKLAEQSANGTYDEGVDRKQLQKEFQKLTDEIDRIADSANFNGIKLLDGSLDGGSTTAATKEIQEQDMSTDLDALTSASGEQKGVLKIDKAATASTTASPVTTYDVAIGGKTYAVAKTNTTKEDQAAAWAEAFNADSANSDWTASASGANITVTSKTNGSKTDPFSGAGTFADGDASNPAKVTGLNLAAASTTESGASNKFDVTIGGKTYAVANSNNTVKLQADAWVDAYKKDTDNAAVVAAYDIAVDTDGNVTFTQKTAADATDKPTDLAGLNNGTWTAGKAGTLDAGQTVTVGGVDYTTKAGDTKATALKNAVDAFNDDADASKNWAASVGTGDDAGKVIFTAKTAGALATTGATAPTGATQKTAGADAGTVAGTGKSMNLQIGDTAHIYNRIQVSIKSIKSTALKDLTTEQELAAKAADPTKKVTAVKADGVSEMDTALTLADISVDTEDNAAEALGALKGMVNYISDIRGELGATQNRLNHTINNLSVMEENIQDAESTIRDTDVADEMMAYTKNNILIQSAQAMLAQANQVPQGVLQLLQ